MICPAGQIYYQSDHGCSCVICQKCGAHLGTNYNLICYKPEIGKNPNNILDVGKRVCQECSQILTVKESKTNTLSNVTQDQWDEIISLLEEHWKD